MRVVGADISSMVHMQPPGEDEAESGEVEFFGVKLKVRNPHLAALLNSSVHEDVQVIGRRARDAFGPADVVDDEQGVERRVLDADDSVELRFDDVVAD